MEGRRRVNLQGETGRAKINMLQGREDRVGINTD